MQRKDPLHTSQNTTLSEQFKTMIESDRNRGNTDTPNTQIHDSSQTHKYMIAHFPGLVLATQSSGLN